MPHLGAMVKHSKLRLVATRSLRVTRRKRRKNIWMILKMWMGKTIEIKRWIEDVLEMRMRLKTITMF